MNRIWKLAILLLLASFLFPIAVRAQATMQVGLLSTVPLGTPVRHLQMSPDETLLAVSIDRHSSVSVIDVQKASVIRTLVSASEAPCVAFSPDSRLLAACGHTIRLWDAQSGQMKSEIVNGVGKLVDAVTFSPDGQSLAAWTGDMEFSPKSQSSFSFHYSGQIKFWDLASLAVVRSLNQYNHTVWAMAFSPDGSALASSGMSVGWKLWDPRTGQLLNEKFEDGIDEIAFVGGGTQFAVASKDKVKILDTGTRKEVRVLKHGAEVRDFACTRDGKILVSAGVDRKVKFWDVASGKVLHTLEVPDQVSQIVLNNDGTLLVTGGDDLKFWKVVRPGV